MSCRAAFHALERKRQPKRHSNIDHGGVGGRFLEPSYVAPSMSSAMLGRQMAHEFAHVGESGERHDRWDDERPRGRGKTSQGAYAAAGGSSSGGTVSRCRLSGDCPVHLGRPLSSNFSRDIPHRVQASRLKSRRWPPAIRSKAIAYSPIDEAHSAALAAWRSSRMITPPSLGVPNHCRPCNKCTSEQLAGWPRCSRYWPFF